MIQRIIDRLIPPAPERKVEIHNMVRLTPEVLADFRRRVGATAVVTNQTTEHMAGYQLGLAHAVNVLTEGFTVSSSPSY